MKAEKSAVQPRKKGVPKNIVPQKDPYFSRATSKAFELLDVLERAEAPCSLNDLADKVRLTKSSTFRLLYTLESMRRVRRDDRGHYEPSRRMDSPAPPARFIQHLCDAAVEPMRKLSMAFRETVSSSVLMGNRIEVVAVIDSPHLVRMSNVVGRILPPHASSMGKAITAFQSRELRDRLITSYGMTIFTPNTLCDQRQLDEYFEEIRKTGISCDDEENTLGGICFGVPIHAPGEQVQAALSLSMPKTRLPKEPSELHAIHEELRRAAADVAKTLAADS